MTATLTESPALPQRIGGLATLARNLGWSWNHDARALYRSIDPTLWRLTRHNPFALLRRVDPARLAACAADPDFPSAHRALAGRRVARDGRARAGVPARHGLGAERSRRPGAVAPAVWRGA